jgi:hypothetical protein
MAMTVMNRVVLTAAICGLLGCKSKQDEAARTKPAGSDQVPEGSANVAAPTPPPAGGSGGPQDVPLPPAGGPDAKYGTCDVTAIGGFSFESHVENQPSAVITDHWHTAETKAANEKLRADAAKRGETYRVPEQPLMIVCLDAPRGVHIRFAPTFSKLADIRPQPQDFPIARNPEDKPGVMRAEVTMREGGITTVGGALHVTRFEQGELAATFELDVETFDEPPKKAKLSGKLTYHCADHARCGMK